MARLAASVIVALWVLATAIISVQNATPVSLRLFGLRSVELPFGVVLAFFAVGGLVVTAALLWWFNLPRRT